MYSLVVSSMGDFDSDSDDLDPQDDYSSISKLATAIVVLLGLFSPVIYSSYGSYMNNFMTIQSIFWSFSTGRWQNGFSFLPMYALFSMFPFVILRLAPAAQIRRYYQGKTTRKRTFLIILVGDIYFLIGGILMFIMTLLYPSFYLSIPLPFQTITGWLILTARPIREPVTPWESTQESVAWWEQKKEESSEAKKVEDNKDELW